MKKEEKHTTERGRRCGVVFCFLYTCLGAKLDRHFFLLVGFFFHFQSLRTTSFVSSRVLSSGASSRSKQPCPCYGLPDVQYLVRQLPVERGTSTRAEREQIE
jgi:hypothetical protein